MRHLTKCVVGLVVLTAAGCSPVKTIVANEYQLTQYSSKQVSAKVHLTTLLVTRPDAVSGYDTEAMLYTDKPFKVETFAKNAWVSAPASMLYPLITQSLQQSGYFYAVTTSPYSESTDFRLDTQLIKLQQNFLKKPSQIDMVTKIVLTDVKGNKVIASRIINQHVNCPMDTPYGGVLAANKAAEEFTAMATDFVVKVLKQART